MVPFNGCVWRNRRTAPNTRSNRSWISRQPLQTSSPQWQVHLYSGRHLGKDLQGRRTIFFLPYSSCCLLSPWEEHLLPEARAGAKRCVEASASGRAARTRRWSRTSLIREGRVPAPTLRTGSANGPDAPWWTPREQRLQTSCVLVRVCRDILSGSLTRRDTHAW